MLNKFNQQESYLYDLQASLCIEHDYNAIDNTNFEQYSDELFNESELFDLSEQSDIINSININTPNNTPNDKFMIEQKEMN